MIWRIALVWLGILAVLHLLDTSGLLTNEELVAGTETAVLEGADRFVDAAEQFEAESKKIGEPGATPHPAMAPLVDIARAGGVPLRIVMLAGAGWLFYVAWFKWQWPIGWGRVAACGAVFLLVTILVHWDRVYPGLVGS